jgi:predicted RNA-binding protein with PUA-like domain
MSGKEAGIYAIAEIITNPATTGEPPAEDKYWLGNEDRGQKRLRVELINKFVLINRPVFRHELRAIEALKNMSILRVAQGTNFPVTPSEWNVIKELINTRIKAASNTSTNTDKG